MPDEQKVIQPLYGPYAGGHITVSAEDADEAISAGIAFDPYGEPFTRPEVDEDTRAKLEETAVIAARKWRGEEEPVEKKKAAKSAKATTTAAEESSAKAKADESAKAAEDTTRDMSAKPAAGDYETRDSSSSSASKRKR